MTLAANLAPQILWAGKQKSQSYTLLPYRHTDRKHVHSSRSISPLDSLRSAHTCMWWWQPTVYQYCTWTCCERAWKPSTTSGCRCKHSNSAGMLLSAIREKMLLYHRPTDTAQTSETVMNVAALTAGDLQCPECLICRHLKVSHITYMELIT